MPSTEKVPSTKFTRELLKVLHHDQKIEVPKIAEMLKSDVQTVVTDFFAHRLNITFTDTLKDFDAPVTGKTGKRVAVVKRGRPVLSKSSKAPAITPDYLRSCVAKGMSIGDIAKEQGRTQAGIGYYFSKFKVSRKLS